MNTPTIIRGAFMAAAIALLWLAPPVGFVAVAILFVILPPWGRTLTERAVISGIVVLGLTGVVFPRASDLLPVNHLSARLFFAGVLVAAVALRLIPRLRSAPYPRPRELDAFVGLFVLVAAWIPISAFRGHILSETVVGDHVAVIPTISGQGYIYGTSQFYVDSSDPWPLGYRVGDTWPNAN